MDLTTTMMEIYSQIDSPALLVNPDAVAANIAEMVKMAGNVDRLRPHIKTHKSAAGIQMMMGAGIYKFKCATIAEAELLAIQQAPDVLLAHQPVGPKIQRLIELAEAYPKTIFSCIIDDIDNAVNIGKAFDAKGREIRVFADINVGMNRTGIKPDQSALELIKNIKRTKGLLFGGLHVYDGQHRQAEFSEREKACDEAFEAVYALIDTMKLAGLENPTVIAGGSPTFSIHANRPDRECSPGTNIFWDHGYSQICREQNFTPAIRILTRVISLPAIDRICVDLGHKAVAAENEINKRVLFPDYPHLKAISQSEEHLVLEAGAGHRFRVGDVLVGIPYHICPTVALHEGLYEIKDGKLTGIWQIESRKRRINY
jgi:D-serine deaminase-like pyridoxal phosphate-dependent protein